MFKYKFGSLPCVIFLFVIDSSTRKGNKPEQIGIALSSGASTGKTRVRGEEKTWIDP